MEDLISAVLLVATLYGGTVTAEKIYDVTREAALTKAARGLPSLAPFAHALTKKPRS